MMNGYLPKGCWNLLCIEGSIEWLRGCTNLENPTTRRCWMIGSLTCFLRLASWVWRKCMHMSFLPNGERWQVQFTHLFRVRLIKVPKAYSWIKFSHLPMIDWIYLFFYTLYVTLHVVLNCAVAPLICYNLFRAIYLALRVWLARITRSGDVILNEFDMCLLEDKPTFFDDDVSADSKAKLKK